MNYSTFNSLFERLKRVWLLRALYRIPWAPRLYHFLLAFTGAVLYRFPSRELIVVGATGTKGKTTVLELLNTVLEGAGMRTALLSSIRIKVGDKSEKNLLKNTQPGRFFIQHFLRRAVREKCDVALLEVTSEGVPLSRHRFIKWDTGMLINLAPEHIEAHGSFENYRNAKLSFLRYASKKGATIFINKENGGDGSRPRSGARPSSRPLSRELPEVSEVAAAGQVQRGCGSRTIVNTEIGRL